MDLKNINNLNEIISKNEFHSLLSQLFKLKNDLSKNKLISYIEILGDKFSKFYDFNELTNDETSELNKILIALTDLTNLKIMEDLIGILFKFRLNSYYLFLKNNLQNIQSDSIFEEIKSAIIEYEHGYKF